MRRKIKIKTRIIFWIVAGTVFFGLGSTAFATYQFTPISGQLVVGTENAINAVTVATPSPAPNIGSWKAALADDNLFWNITASSAAGFDMQLTVGGVRLNGANTLQIQSEVVITAIASASIQICDWTSSTGVDNAADARCTGGGWRTIVNREAPITATNATTYQYTIYDGYWSNGGNEAYSTPLTNFVNSSNNILIRYYSASGSSANIGVDYLRIYAVINSIYAPAEAVVTQKYTGIINGVAASNTAYAIAKDSTYMYVAGANSSGNWRIEKRLLNTGGLDTGFGTDGIIDGVAASQNAYAIAIDTTHMYIVGSGSNWRIEKRLLTTGALDTDFDSDGVIEGAATSNVAFAIAIDSTYTYMYVAGYDSSSNWRIEKRLLTTGALDTGFDTDGIIDGDAASNNARAIAIDITYMYVVGIDDSSNWRIEKRLLTTGALDTGFDSDGIIDGAAASEVPRAIAIDSTYMYVAGDDASDNWRIEKRLLTTGALDTGFDSDGIIDGVAVTQTAYAIAIYITYIYINGDASDNWRTEKRLLSTGALDTNFDSDGIIDGAAASQYAQAIAIDTKYMYVVGYDVSNNLRIEKRLLSSGGVDVRFGDQTELTGGYINGLTASNTAYAVAQDSEYIYTVGDNSSNYLRIEKRSKATGNLDSRFGTSGVITSAATSRTAYAIAIDSTFMYVAGYDSSINWRIEKRYLLNGALFSDFGSGGIVTGAAASNYAYAIAIDSTYMYVVGGDDSSNWRIEKRLLTTGALDTNFDSDGIIDGVAASNDAYAIAIDNTYMYVAGDDDSVNWRIEKRLLTTGALDTSFDSDGIIDGAAASNVARAIAIDRTYMYIAGLDDSTNFRIEKRLLSTGALDTGFDSDGVVDGAEASSVAQAIAIDNTYMYVAGQNDSSNWRIEKRLLSTGALDTSFDTDGVIDVATSNNAYAIALDSAYMYVAGVNNISNWQIEKRLLTTGAYDTDFGIGQLLTDSTVVGTYQFTNAITAGVADNYRYEVGGSLESNADFYLKFKNIKTYTGMNTILVRSESSCSAITTPYGLKYRFAVRNFNSSAWEDMTADIDCSTTDEVLVFAKNNIATISNYINNGEIWIRMYGKDNGLSTIRLDFIYIMLGTVNSDAAGAGTISFGTEIDGRLLVNPSSGAGGTDSINSIAVDGTSLYLGGYDTMGGDEQWRLEKRNVSDGALVTAFGASGTVNSDLSINSDRIQAVSVNGDYVYTAGYKGVSTSNYDWYIEKRNKTTGALEWAQQGTPSARLDTAFSMFVDDSGIYLAGDDRTTSTTDGRWRIEKRLLTDGTLDSGFGGHSSVSSDPSTGLDIPYSIVASGSYIYIGGVDYTTGTAGQWRIEKRDKTNGALDSATPFGTGGVVNVDVNAGFPEIITAMAVRGANLYATGYDSSSATEYRWRTEKFKLSDGSVVEAFGTSGVVITNATTNIDQAYAITTDTTSVYIAGMEYVSSSRYRWRVEKRNLTDGLKDTTFNSYGAVNSDEGGDERIRAVALSGTSVFTAGYTTSFPDTEWMVEKRNISDGLFSNDGFGTTGTYSDYRSTRNIDMTASLSVDQWMLQMEDESTDMGLGGAGQEFYALDVPSNATLDEGVAARIPFSVTPPTNATVVGINYAARNMGGANGATRIGLKDYSGLNSATGGITLTAAAVTTTNTYADPITAATPASNTVAYSGFMLNPTNYIDSVNNKMEMALVTTTISPLASNSTAIWDFAMVSLSWIEDTDRNSKTYQFVPVSGQLVTGTEQTITSGTAAASTGVNVGSWKGTLADDNEHWVIAGASPGGADVQLTLGGAQLNGANTLMVQTEFVVSDAALGTALQICDFMSSASVDRIADAQCARGGWRTLNNRDVLISSTTAYAYAYNLYDGYWGSELESVSTPLTNFINDSHQMLFSYYSSASSTATLAIDYLRAFAVINPSYSASEVKIISTDGAVTGAAASYTANAIAKDSTYMYVAGYNDSNNWRIEKRLLSTGALDTSFGTAGIITSDATSYGAEAIAIDTTYMYVAGYDDSFNWRIEKRLLSTGALDTNFDTDGIIDGDAASKVAYAIAIDNTYMYVSGGNDSFNSRIEKRLLSTGALDTGFDTDGIIDGDAASQVAYAIAIDTTHMYVAGIDDSTNWRIEKRLLTTGALDTSFDSDGIIDGVAASSGARAIAVDNTHMYVAGYDASDNWRIEKRLLSTGALDTGFDSDGIIDGAAVSESARAIAIDTTYMYVAGYDNSINWRIEKRLLSTGALDTGFDTDGIINGVAAGASAQAIAIDSTYMYVAGSDDSNNWRIEKRDLAGGYADVTFGNGAGGTSEYRATTVVTNSNTPTNAGASDDARFRVAGSATSNADFYFKFKNIRTYTGMNAILIRPEASCSAATLGLSYKFAIRNFGSPSFAGVWEDISGPIECTTTDTTYAFAVSSVDVNDYIRNGEIWVRMFGSFGTTTELRVDSIYVMLGTVNSTKAGSGEVSFGTATAGRLTENPSSGSGMHDQIATIAIDGDYMYLGGYDMSGGDQEWRLEKRNVSDGALVTAFGTGGIVTYDNGAYPDQILSVAVYGDYVYGAGFVGDSTTDYRWYIRRWNKTTGAVDWSQNENLTARLDAINSMYVDSTGIYVAGSDYRVSTTDSQWKIEKRALADGTLDAGFGSHSSVSYDASTGLDIPYAIVSSGSYIYIGGADVTTGTTGKWRVEKRDKTTGALDTATPFGVQGSISHDFSSARLDTVTAMAVRGAYLYVTGTDFSPSATDQRWVTAKYALSDGALQTTWGTSGYVYSNPTATVDRPTAIATDERFVYVAGYDTSATAARLRIEKYSLSSGAEDAKFNGGGSVIAEDGGDDQFRAIAVNDQYIFAAGYGTGPGDNQWLVEKREKSSGEMGNTAVSSDSDSTVAYAITKDSIYMYVAGNDDSSNWRIEKRLLSTGALDTGFDTDGIIDGAAASNTAQGIAIDSTYMYVVGYDDGNNWRIEKRLLSTGALDTGFDTDGIIDGAATSYRAYAIAIDSTYMYVAGDDDSSNWRIEKRLLSTGALDTNFDSDGIIDGVVASNYSYAIAIDSTYMYVIGADESQNWRIEKRLLSTGVLDTNFDSDGVVVGVVASYEAYAIAIDSTYMYIAGNDDSNNWRIEKRLLSTGALDVNFNSDGIIDGITASNAAFAIAIDNTYMYIAGYDDNSNWRIEKRLLSTGSLDTNFDSDGIINNVTASNTALAISLDATYMYITGNNKSSNWRIEKRLLTSGANGFPSSSFGSTSSISSTRTLDMTQNTTSWAINMENETTTMGHSYYPLDVPANATSDEGAAVRIPFSVTVPEDAQVVGIDWAVRLMAGTSGAVKVAFKDYSGLTGTSGGSYSVAPNTAPTTAMTYNDPIMSNSVSNVYGVGGFMVNPEDFIDTVNNKMEMAMQTTTLANAASNSTAMWDFAMVSFAYIDTSSSYSTYNQSAYRFFGDPMVDFGTDGVVTAIASSQVAYAIATDSTYMYVAGYDDSTNWRIEKRLLSTGALDTSFDSDGIVSGASASQVAYAIAIDSTYMYVAGYDDSDNWRIEKRLLTTGALDTSFDSDGIIDGAAASAIAYAIAIDSTYMYVAGWNASVNWRIEKRLLSTGALDTSFDSDGIIDGAAASDTAYAIAIDSTYMYVAGYNASGNWRIEKRLLTTGALDTSFDSDGIVDGATASDHAEAIAIDNTYMYVVGYDRSNNLRIEKRLLSTGALDTNFDSDGIIDGDAASDYALGIAIDNTYMYVVGANSSNNWRIEKRLLSTGALDTSFDSDGIVSGASASQVAYAIAIDSTYMYVAGYDQSNNWRIEKRLLSYGTTADISDAGYPLAAANTAAEVTADGTFRLRTVVHVDGLDVPNGGQKFKLQFANKPALTACSALTYSDVTTTSSISFVNRYTDSVKKLWTNANDPSGGYTTIAQSFVDTNNFSIGAASVSANQDAMWDFRLKDYDATAEDSFCFRIVKSSGSWDTYTVYPQMKIVAAAGEETLTQNAYRWYESANAVQPTTAVGAENTSSTLPPNEIANGVRLRINLSVGQSYLLASRRSFLLQYANSESGPWSNVGATGSGATWTYKANSTLSDGENIATVLLSDSNIKGAYRQASSSVLNPNGAGVGQKIEWDYSLDSSNAATGTTYYFRLILTNGNALAGYTRYAVLRVGDASGSTTPTEFGSGGGTPRSEGTESAPTASQGTEAGSGGGTPRSEGAGTPGDTTPASP